MPTSVNGAQLTRLVDNSGHTLSIRADGAIGVTTGGVPESSKFYITTLIDAPGVVAANNFLSLFNPVGSGRNVVVFFAQTIPWATAATTADASMNVFRTTAASAGTLTTASTIGRFITTDGSPVAEVRTGNPTVTTTGQALLGTPPAITSAGSGTSGGSVSNSTPGASFLLVPGEGIVWRTTLGDVDQRWNLQIIWAEF